MPQTERKHEFFTLIAAKDLWILGIARKPFPVDNFVCRIIMSNICCLNLKQ